MIRRFDELNVSYPFILSRPYKNVHLDYRDNKEYSFVQTSSLKFTLLHFDDEIPILPKLSFNFLILVLEEIFLEVEEICQNFIKFVFTKLYNLFHTTELKLP